MYGRVHISVCMCIIHICNGQDTFGDNTDKAIRKSTTRPAAPDNTVWADKKKKKKKVLVDSLTSTDKHQQPDIEGFIPE